MRQPK